MISAISAAARRNLEAHIEGERQRDLDALMAPLCDNPSYVIPDFLLLGRAAVRVMYELALPTLADGNAEEYRRALDDPAVTRWGQDHCVIEYSDAYPLHRDMVVVIHFEDDRVKSENTYYRVAMPPPPLGTIERFLATPGVIPLAGHR